MQFAILSHFIVAFCYIAMGYSDDMRKKIKISLLLE